MSQTHALGIDIGGTFTDIVVYDRATGRISKGKGLTTPDDPSRGVLTGLKKLLEHDVAPDSLYRIVHATTLFTNALIERKGARTGLITTKGFRDVLEIGRERKYELYDIYIAMPKPLAPRDLRLEVTERIAPDGSEITPLDEAELLQRVGELVALGVESIAIVFLHAYANPEHEDAALAAIATNYPDLIVTASHDVAPEIREYDRTSTTVTNAYVKPLAHTYVDQLVKQTADLGVDAPYFMMLSNGGLTHIDEAKRSPVQLLESGPAAGALVAAYFGSRAGIDNVLAFDMGGTTAKLALVEDGEPHVDYHFEAAREKRFAEGSGLPLNISAIKLIEIGAGGGSIAHIDAMDLLKVGPESAGSEPGPVCYARGGEAPTVTDADLLLGFLNAEYFAGGSMKIDRDATARAMQPLADRTGLSVVDVARGIYDVVNENMASAARVHIAEQGKDPRQYTLLATGGAGPVHAYYVAKKLGVKRLFCPLAAGVASALGLLIAPARIDRVVTIASRLSDMDWPRLEAAFKDLETDAAKVIEETGFDPATARITRLADMRYIGQGFEVVTELPDGPYNANAAPALLKSFEDTYRKTFSRTPPDVNAEIINIRVSLRADVPGDGVGFTATAETENGTKTGRTRPVRFPENDDYIDTAVFDRSQLRAGETFEGPAVIEESESTLIVGPGSTVQVDVDGNLLVELPEDPQ
ncbi:MAG: hydantoinase/oxoprolinase family protein [Alphaproteobacteria bacterium]|nr:hydantoinase/oxoprolinase family protein [Alphaproteobacteria bacterium]